MVVVSKKVASVTPMVEYDHLADVLYVSLGPPEPDEGEDRERGVVLRFAVKDNHPTGVTVVGLRRNQWNDRLAELAQIVAAHLDTDDVPVMFAMERKLKETMP